MSEQSKDALIESIVQSIGILSERIKVLQENQAKIIVAVNLLGNQGKLGKHLEALGVENFVEGLATESAPRDDNEIHKKSLVILLDDLLQLIIYLDDRVDRLENLHQLPTLPEKKIKFKYEI